MNQVYTRWVPSVPTFRQANKALTFLVVVLYLWVAYAPPAQYTLHIEMPGMLLLLGVGLFLYWLFIVYSASIYDKKTESARVYFLWILSALIVLEIPFDLPSRSFVICSLYVSSLYLYHFLLPFIKNELSKQ